MKSMMSLSVPLRPRPAGAAAPLTAPQRRFWRWLSENRRPNDRRVCESSLRIEGPLCQEALRRSIETVLHRHESLRTTIDVVDGAPVQKISSESGHQLDVVDLPINTDMDIGLSRFIETFSNET